MRSRLDGFDSYSTIETILKVTKGDSNKGRNKLNDNTVKLIDELFDRINLIPVYKGGYDQYRNLIEDIFLEDCLFNSSNMLHLFCELSYEPLRLIQSQTDKILDKKLSDEILMYSLHRLVSSFPTTNEYLADIIDILSDSTDYKVTFLTTLASSPYMILECEGQPRVHIILQSRRGMYHKNPKYITEKKEELTNLYPHEEIGHIMIGNTTKGIQYVVDEIVEVIVNSINNKKL